MTAEKARSLTEFSLRRLRTSPEAFGWLLVIWRRVDEAAAGGKATLADPFAIERIPKGAPPVLRTADVPRDVRSEVVEWLRADGFEVYNNNGPGNLVPIEEIEIYW